MISGHRATPPDHGTPSLSASERRRSSIRPRFTVEEARILRAAMHVFAQSDKAWDTRALYEKVTRMTDSLEERER